MLLEKNRKYGDSALNPSRTFAKSDSVEQIKVRIDDKLNRIKNAQGDEDEDVLMDLMGYLVLLRIAMMREKSTPVTDSAPPPILDPNKPIINPAYPIYPYRIGDPGPQPYYPQPTYWQNPTSYNLNTYHDGHDQQVDAVLT